MTPAETLRAAAAKVRDTASRATPGPWQIDPEFSDMVTSQEPNWNGNPTVIASDLHDGEVSGDWNNVAWVALASPEIAKHIADWLDAEADAWPAAPVHTSTWTTSRRRRAALALARDITGQDSETGDPS